MHLKSLFTIGECVSCLLSKCCQSTLVSGVKIAAHMKKSCLNVLEKHFVENGSGKRERLECYYCLYNKVFSCNKTLTD